MTTRRLFDSESPRVGDVFMMWHGPFGTAIVTHVHSDGAVDAERPMMQITGGVPSPAITVERISRISAESIRRYEFSTTNDEVENRWYDELARTATCLSSVRKMIGEK